MAKQLQKSAIYLLAIIGLTTNTFAQTWQTVGQAGFSAGRANYTSLAFNHTGEPYVAYMDGANSDKATVMKFDGTNWITVGAAGFSSGRALSISLAFSHTGEPYVAYTDFANSNHITVMKFNGNNWVTVGTAGFSPGSALYSSLTFNGIGEPYVAFSWNAIGFKGGGMVMKFDGVNWVTVGTGNFSPSLSDYTSLAFSPSGEPYVAYRGSTTSTTGAMVMKFDGTNWVNVGTQGFSTGSVELFTSIAFNSNSKSDSDKPYVAYSDRLTSGKVTVMEFDGTNWNTIGIAGFSAGEAKYISLAFNHSGEPYVAYWDDGNSRKATVMKFDGTNWITVGTAGFSAGTAGYTSLAFSHTGEPYVAYGDYGNSGKATVMKFANTASVNETSNSITTVYPNPTNNLLNIDISTSLNTTENINIMIVDITGKTVATHQLKIGNNTVNISHLANGMYFIKSDEGGTATKFIKK